MKLPIKKPAISISLWWLVKIIKKKLDKNKQIKESV